MIGRQAGRTVRHLRVPGETVSERLRVPGPNRGSPPTWALHGMLADGYEDVVTAEVELPDRCAGHPPRPVRGDFTARFAPDPAIAG